MLLMEDIVSLSIEKGSFAHTTIPCEDNLANEERIDLPALGHGHMFII